MRRARQLSDLRGFSRLAVEATVGLTDLVEEVHRSVTTLPAAGAPNPARIRSAGITDLRYGEVIGERGALPLPRGVTCYAVAATLAKGPDLPTAVRAQAAAKTVLGDGLVPLASAFGDDIDPARALAIPSGRRFMAHGIHHLDLLDSGEVYAQIRVWLEAPVEATR